MVSKDSIRVYTKVYPEFTKMSVVKTLREIEKKHGRLDSVTVHYYLALRMFGGLGKGKLRRMM